MATIELNGKPVARSRPDRVAIIAEREAGVHGVLIELYAAAGPGASSLWIDGTGTAVLTVERAAFNQLMEPALAGARRAVEVPGFEVLAAQVAEFKTWLAGITDEHGEPRPGVTLSQFDEGRSDAWQRIAETAIEFVAAASP